MSNDKHIIAARKKPEFEEDLQNRLFQSPIKKCEKAPCKKNRSVGSGRSKKTVSKAGK